LTTSHRKFSNLRSLGIKEFVELTGADRAASLDPLVVHREPLDEDFRETGRGPLTECGAAGRDNAVADGGDGGERVVLDVAGNVAGAFALN
jgi:hypothetical protein